MKDDSSRTLRRALFPLALLAAALAACSPSPAPVAAPATLPAAAVASTPAPVQEPAAAEPAVKSAAKPQPVTTAAAEAAPPAPPPVEKVVQEAPPPPKPVCATCGKVEAVTPIAVQGEGSGLGAVGGAVLGGVIGHQMGGGRGKTAMTVIGAAGGGMAGNEVEKRHNASTRYQLRIRMADGSTRTITQDLQMVVGQKVTVKGDQVTLAQ